LLSRGGERSADRRWGCPHYHHYLYPVERIGKKEKRERNIFNLFSLSLFLENYNLPLLKEHQSLFLVFWFHNNCHLSTVKIGKIRFVPLQNLHFIKRESKDSPQDFYDRNITPFWIFTIHIN
jgi:hypothetical protein